MGNPLDKIREIVDKVVPNEIKGYLGTAAAVGLPALGGGMVGGFAQSFLTDILMQKLLYDEDANKETDYLKAATSGVIGGARNIESGIFGNKDPVKRIVDIDKAGIEFDPTTKNYQAITQGDKSAIRLSKRLNMGDASALTPGPTISGAPMQANYFKSDFLSGIADAATPFQYEGIGSSANPLIDFAKETGSSLGILQAGNTPSQVRDAKKALEAAEDRYNQYIAEQKAKYGADFEEDRQTRIAAYKKYMGSAGYSEDEINDALRVAGYIGDEETAYAANGGRIGFANGSDSYMGDVYGDRDRDSLDMKEFYKDNPEAQVGTYINENRYKSEKIEKLETKLNEIIDMRQRTADRSRNPENDGMPSLMEKLLDKEIKALYADRTNDDLRKTRMQKLEEQEAARQQEAIIRAEQMKAAYQAEFGDGLNRTGRAMGGMMRPNYNMGGMMNAGMMNNNMMNPRMGYAMGSQDRPNFNYGSGRQTPQGDPIAPNVPPGMQMDLRPGGFIELGTEPRADDVPAMVGKDEFVLNDRAVAGIGKLITGQPDARAGAKALYDLQNKMEATV